MIQAKDLSSHLLTGKLKQRGHDPKILLDRITYDFKSGKVYAVIGPNGSGKTTLLRCLAGLQALSSGQLTIKDQPIGQLKSLARAKLISWVPAQHDSPFHYSIEETILWGRWAYHQGSPRSADLEAVRLAASCFGLADRLQESVTTLSLGELKKVHLARSLVAETPYSLWDEPSGSLDIRAAIDLLKLAKAKASASQTFIITSHDIGLAIDWADEILILNAGQLEWHGPADAQELMAAVSKVFRVQFERRAIGEML